MSLAAEALALKRPEYGGFWVRLGALLLDLLWIVPLVVGGGFIVFGYAYFNVNFGQYVGWQDFVFTNLLTALAVLGFWFQRGATPGKMLLRLRIVDATTLGKPTPRQLLIRYCAYALGMLSGYFAVIMIIGYLWVAFDRRSQGLHDKLAGTVVIRVDD